MIVETIGKVDTPQANDPDEEISIPLTKTEWCDVMEALLNSNDPHASKTCDKIRSALKEAESKDLLNKSNS